MCDIHESATLATIMQKDVFDYTCNFRTKALMTMILASRSMFFKSRNPTVPFVLSMTLTFQGHDLCKSHFGPVRLLKYTPLLFLMLNDGLCSTLDWQMQYTQVQLLMYMMAYSVHKLAYTVHHVRLLIYMIEYADHLMANAVHPREAPEVHLSVVSNVR